MLMRTVNGTGRYNGQHRLCIWPWPWNSVFALSDRNCHLLSPGCCENAVRTHLSLTQGRCSVMVVDISRGLLSTPELPCDSLPISFKGNILGWNNHDHCNNRDSQWFCTYSLHLSEATGEEKKELKPVPRWVPTPVLSFVMWVLCLHIFLETVDPANNNEARRKTNFLLAFPRQAGAHTDSEADPPMIQLVSLWRSTQEMRSAKALPLEAFLAISWSKTKPYNNLCKMIYN